MADFNQTNLENPASELSEAEVISLIQSQLNNYQSQIRVGTNSDIIRMETSEGFSIGGTTFTNSPFRVNMSGDLTATSATITGSITSTSGTIGGFTLGATTLSATNLTLTSGAANTANIAVGTGSDLAGMNSGNSGTDIAFWAGDTHANRATAPFRVNLQGDVTAESITLPADALDQEVWADVLGDYNNRNDAPLAASTVTSYGIVARFADSATPSGQFRVKVPKGATSISKIEVFFERNATGDLYCVFYSAYYATSAGGTIGSDNTDSYAAYTVSGGTGVTDLLTVPAAAYNGLTIAAGNIVELTVFRDSSHASDTYNTFWPVVGALFTFA